MIVDSCMDRNKGKPVALEYLEQLGVDVATCVKLVVATHWHNDHTRGIREVLSQALEARFVCARAMRREEFSTALGFAREPTHAPLRELESAWELMRTRAEGMMWASANRTLLKTGMATVTSLSPGDEAETRSLEEISRLIPDLGSNRRREVSHTPNQLSVVLWIEHEHGSVLLGGDLEREKDPRLGWQAIINSTERPEGRAAVYKVAHHGSANADDDGIWEELLESRPAAFVTPFRCGLKPLPSVEDRERILARTSRLYIAARPDLSRSVRRDSVVEKTVRFVAGRLKATEGDMGQIRYRSESDTIETFGPAAQYP